MIATAGPNAVLSGVFFDPVDGSGAGGSGAGSSGGGAAESVSVNPTSTSLSAGATQQFSATVANGPSQSVAWTIISVSPSGAAPGSFSTTTLGLYTAPATITTAETVSIQAMSADGQASGTATVNLTAAATTGNTAAFIRMDTATEGNWPAAYGVDGYTLANESIQKNPGYATFQIQNQQGWRWASNTSDPRALTIPSALGGIAATWYNASSFSFTVKVTDGATHQFALYAMDWDKQGRSETIQIVDASTGSVLNTQNISNFSNGLYLIWDISGSIQINVTAKSGPNAVASGVFFDPVNGSSGIGGNGSTDATESVSVNPTTTNLTSSGTRQFSATVTNGPSQAVTWTILSVSPTGANPGSFSFATPGLYAAPATIAAAETVTIQATTADGNASGMATINLIPTVTGGSTGATFIRADAATEGHWQGTYGTDGEALANFSPQNIPSYATFQVQNQSSWTWFSNTSDPRALVIPSGSGGIAAAWYGETYGPTAFAFNTNISGSHELAVYAIDWDSLGRSETIQILDATTKAALDTRPISNFTNGIYLVWNISGNVIINVAVNSGPNAVVSGVFFGGN